MSAILLLIARVKGSKALSVSTKKANKIQKSWKDEEELAD
jgi:hypothetical protein